MENCKDLQALFSLDCQLLFNFAYICPKCDIAGLCDNIHLPYAVSVVTMKLDNIKFLGSQGSIEVSCNTCVLSF